MKRIRAWRRKRGSRNWSDYRFLLLIIFGFIALVLGYIGFMKNGISNGEDRTILDNLYLMLGLFSMNSARSFTRRRSSGPWPAGSVIRRG